jgi:hypothetical protein
MTASKLLIVALVGLLLFDYKFNDGRLVDALSVQMTQFGYWLNKELSSLERLVAPFRG